MALELRQTTLQCPIDGSYLFIAVRTNYNVETGVEDTTLSEGFCQRCDPAKYVEIIRAATKITMLKLEDITGRQNLKNIPKKNGARPR